MNGRLGKTEMTERCKVWALARRLCYDTWTWPGQSEQPRSCPARLHALPFLHHPSDCSPHSTTPYGVPRTPVLRGGHGTLNVRSPFAFSPLHAVEQ